MIGLLQRVRHAQVRVDEQTLAAIDQGLLVLVGVQRGDTEASAARLLERVLGYRIFADAHGRMNQSLTDVQGGLLLVPQFTLAADTQRGSRPGFSPAASPAEANALFAWLCDHAQQQHPTVGCGVFAADMQVELCNDGPVTFWLEAPPRSRSA
ncbi:MAG: D-aminoacyl-tRNA deacylase [Spiribacter sp.]|jgi:D-tyrosyl-tRNA(Tyr) deacylase|nr:D-aminoacyl-tRNA deacylase [Spiribacter sp.]MDR9489405.1 D-aminoacyl-tRNA deacylase [Spiribacter sp.]